MFRPKLQHHDLPIILASSSSEVCVVQKGGADLSTGTIGTKGPEGKALIWTNCQFLPNPLLRGKWARSPNPSHAGISSSGATSQPVWWLPGALASELVPWLGLPSQKLTRLPSSPRQGSPSRSLLGFPWKVLANGDPALWAELYSGFFS